MLEFDDTQALGAGCSGLFPVRRGHSHPSWACLAQDPDGGRQMYRIRTPKPMRADDSKRAFGRVGVERNQMKMA